MTSTDELALETLLDTVNVPFAETTLERVRLLVAQVEALQAQCESNAKRPPRERLLAMLEEDRNHVLTLLADACMDEADEADARYNCSYALRLRAEAKGWAWLAQHRKWPSGRPDGWRWYLAGPRDRDSSVLDDRLAPFIATCPRDKASPRAALEWVVDLIASGRWKPEE